jgi:hypothetical protein
MNRRAAIWILGAVIVLGLAVLSIAFGMTLMPSRATMLAKLGTLAPWILTWGMIWTTVLIAVALAAFLVATGVSEARKTNE